MINNDDELFQFILTEGKSTSDLSKKSNVIRSRRVNQIELPKESSPLHNSPMAILTSSTTTTANPETSYAIDEEEMDELTAFDEKEEMEENDEMKYGSLSDEERMKAMYEDKGLVPPKKSFVQQLFFSYDKNKTVKSRMVKGDYSGIVTDIVIPFTIISATTVWGTIKILKKYNIKMEALLQSYADEMIYHDGDFEEMQMCTSDYKRRLITLGPKKKKVMLGRYLETYATKKQVSPQSISSMSHVFSMYKLSEERAAQALVQTANESLKDKPASAGKLLFFGEKILSSSGGLSGLEPIRKMLIGSYRVAGKEIMETSQIAMSEAAYRAAIAAAGKDQTSLTPGWEILGLTQEKAEEIFTELAKDGFKSKRELENSMARLSYDSKGRRVLPSGELVDPLDYDDDDDDDDDGGATASAYECTECGYTMFPAKGREFKFMPAGFTCPDCGCGKDKFNARET